MSITSQADILTRGLLIESLLREAPLRVVDLAESAGLERRTVERILASLRTVGAWRRSHGMPWYELTVEVRGAERYHRLVDYPAVPQRDSRR
jgi:DNA-binding IclR family transcriptional regulator